MKLIEAFPIREVQTDNGTEWRMDNTAACQRPEHKNAV